MADSKPINIVRSPFTLRELIQVSATGPFGDRIKNAERDVKHRVTVESVIQWKVNYPQGTPNREKIHTYRLRVISVKPDGEVSDYPVTILLQNLSLDSPVKIRCGGLQRYTNKDTMKEKKLCGDFYFRYLSILKRYGVLYDKDNTNHHFPFFTNPEGSIGLCKHCWAGIINCLLAGFFHDSSTIIAKESKKFIEQYL
jgi:hypothetical protein